MSNNSSTGGYLTPTSSRGQPGGLTLTQFIQSVLVGVTGFDGSLVRPEWQVAPPKEPDITVDWIAYGITIDDLDANAYVALNGDGSSNLTRQESLQITCSFYGPNALENISILRDSFQIQQNLEALTLASMGFKEISSSIRSADLFNERWYNRYITTLTLVRQVQRTYSVLSFVSAQGTIHTELENGTFNIPWQTPEAP